MSVFKLRYPSTKQSLVPNVTRSVLIARFRIPPPSRAWSPNVTRSVMCPYRQGRCWRTAYPHLYFMQILVCCPALEIVFAQEALNPSTKRSLAEGFKLCNNSCSAVTLGGRRRRWWDTLPFPDQKAESVFRLFRYSTTEL